MAIEINDVHFNCILIIMILLTIIIFCVASHFIDSYFFGVVIAFISLGVMWFVRDMVVDWKYTK